MSVTLAGITGPSIIATKERLARFWEIEIAFFKKAAQSPDRLDAGETEQNLQEKRAMRSQLFRRFEPLENRLCLSVSVAVTDGDLVVSGDADGAVEIVAVSEGAYRVTDNGVLIADETTLVGVTDDIHIDLEGTDDGANDTVTVDLGGQAVDRIYAELGDGDNVFEVLNGTATSLVYRGGDGIDSVSIDATVESRATLTLGDGDNDLTVTSAVGNLAIHGGDGADLVAIAESATVSGGITAKLGDGDNSLTLAGDVEGHLLVSARDGADTVSVAETATVGRSARIALGDGDNSLNVAGAIDGNLGYDGGDGNDSVSLIASAVIGQNFSARLGGGENTVTHEGTVEGDFRIVSFNEDDTVDIADAAVIGGETILGLGEQREHRGCGLHPEGLGRALEALTLNGRQLGFFYRGFRR
jgi:hypothetical protein